MNTPPSLNTPPSRRWVWHCTDASIAAGHISVLAVLETLAAVGLYWWLSFRFEWPWFSMVGLLAAPMLLLRSEESIALGVEMLRRWHNRSEGDVNRKEKVVVMLIVISIVFFLIINHWLPGNGYGFRSFWLSLADAIMSASGEILTNISIKSRAVIFLINIVILDSLLIIIYILGVTAIAIMVLGVGAAAGVDGNTMGAWKEKKIIALFFGPTIAFGILLRALLIRWFASLRYLLPGLKCLPYNWRENLLFIDITHPPELLPLARKVDKNFFTVSGIWRSMFDRNGYWKIFFICLIISWYISALSYRWSLKQPFQSDYFLPVSN